MAAEHRGGRQLARGEGRRSVAGSLRRRRFDLVQFRRRCRARRAAAEAARRRRRRQARIAAGDGGAERRSPIERDLKQFKIQAVSQATLDTDAANLKNAKAQVAQQQAILDKKIAARAVCRPSRHSRRRSRPISRRRHRHRDAAGARSDLSRFLRAAAVGRSGSPRPDGGGEGRRVQGSDLSRRNLGDQSQGRCRRAATFRSAPR